MINEKIVKLLDSPNQEDWMVAWELLRHKRNKLQHFSSKHWIMSPFTSLFPRCYHVYRKENQRRIGYISLNRRIFKMN